MNKSEKKVYRSELWRNTKKNKELVFMGLPVFLWVLLFHYVPMVGILLAFKDYNFIEGFFGSDWIGFKNFEFLFKSGKVWTLTFNTVAYNIANLTIGTISRLIFAVFLAEITGKYFKKACQTVSILPHFISWVIVGIFFYNIFNYESGVLNNIITTLGGEKIQVYAKPEIWKYLIVGTSTWKEIGYGSVVYLAAIKGIDTGLYEAAQIDGAGIWKRMWYITLPSLVPTIITLFILSLGGVLRGNFEMFYQLVGDNQALQQTTEVIDTYVFKAVLSGTDYGLTSAVSLYQSVICCITVLIVNKLIKLYDKDYALF